jgi:hypothetical protein
MVLFSLRKYCTVHYSTLLLFTDVNTAQYIFYRTLFFIVHYHVKTVQHILLFFHYVNTVLFTDINTVQYIFLHDIFYCTFYYYRLPNN